MKTTARDPLKLILARLRAYGFLLESDPLLPSVCSLVTGEPQRGSWWSHPQAQTIFQVNELLDDHADVLVTKLVSGKVTWVHRKLWPELLAVGSSNAEWQLKGLSQSAKGLLELVDIEGMIRTDHISWPTQLKTKPGEAARELEKRLLVVSCQVHTESGAHAKNLETWEHWKCRTSQKAASISPEQASKTLELRLAKLNREFGGKATLPWN